MRTVGSISISKALIQKLSIEVAPLIVVRVGALMVKTRLQVHNGDRANYILSPELIQALLLKKSKKLKVRYQADDKILHLGPTIGIMAAYIPGSGREEVDPRSLQAELIYLSIVGKSFAGQVYIFTPNGINWANNTCRGYVYRQYSSTRGKWESAIFPLPDVVYDRIHSRAAEARNNVKYCKNRLMQLPYIKYFNPHYLNKWNVHQIMVTNPLLHSYLPETMILDHNNLEEMLGKYKSVFLKPSNGSLGKGIIKVSANTGRLSYVIYKEKRITGKAQSISDLLQKTKKIRADRPYIVQQGLELVKYRGASFDLRIIYQKNGRGEWQISKEFCRIAPRGSSISNLSSGGRVEKSGKVLAYLFKNQTMLEARNEQIRLLCKMIAGTLESNTKSTFGELGMDIGIDRKGNLYLIEVNSKPRKTTDSQISNVVVKHTFKRPLAYASYLAGFKN